MRQDSKTIKELYAQYQKPNMTRAERQELMEKIARERYKTDPRKPISQKGQAVSNLACGLVIFIIALLQLVGIKATGSFAPKVGLIIAAAICVVAGYFEVKRKKEPADELSKELMLKATSYSAYAQIIVVWLVGFIATMVANKSDIDHIKVNSDNLMGLTLLLLGVYLLVRNGVYLWLDRTPKSEDEEE